MKLILIIMAVVVLTGCMTELDRQLAREYRLDLQHHQYAVNFAKENMTEEAVGSCMQAKILKSECFVSLVQYMMSNEVTLKKEYCDEIKPGQSVNMTMNAFRLVYPVIDKALKKDIKEKLRPSKQNIASLEYIKEECYKKAE